MQSNDDETENMSVSTVNPNVIKFTPTLKWTESELLGLIDRLVHMLAVL